MRGLREKVMLELELEGKHRKMYFQLLIQRTENSVPSLVREKVKYRKNDIY